MGPNLLPRALTHTTTSNNNHYPKYLGRLGTNKLLFEIAENSEKCVLAMPKIE
jgi:hypothetical protein